MNKSRSKTISILLIAGIAISSLGSCSSTVTNQVNQNLPLPTTAETVSPGLKVISEVHVDTRLEDLTMTTPALSFPVSAYVLLPTNYNQNPTKRYPVIYVLHGGSPGPNTGLEYREWIDAGAIVQDTANLDVICVFPQAGSGGWYTNWFNNGKGGSPEWETFHVDQLVPYVDQTYRTISNRNGRALLGESMGGYGVMEYASRHPDLFGTAAAFSGAVDIGNPPEIAGPKASLIVGIMASGDGGTPTSPFGSFENNEIVWRNHDPADLVQNLKDTNLYLYCGNGTPGPLDTPETVSDFSKGIEQIVYESNLGFEEQLAAYHIPAFIDNYGAGTHSWPYWRRDLIDVLPRIMNDFKSTKPWPNQVTYTTADSSFSQWGYSVSFQRKVSEFATLSEAGESGFNLSGSGIAVVTTPTFYPPTSNHSVAVTAIVSNQHSSETQIVKSDSEGRLTVTINLGPSNSITEYSPGWSLKDTKVFQVKVTIK
ncbi:MAG: esterase family protein [Acidimicrobiales bacterium]|nr:esterase family protein [Acidimicrobiales bacterium]